jgi:methylated-DNA-protein-cysteine methyltransferase related protein
MPKRPKHQIHQQSFQDNVIEVVKQIPYGRVTSYGAIARLLGLAKSARLVGYVLNSYKFNLDEVPAHRVVNRNGLLTGAKHFHGLSMSEKLEMEGIKVTENQIQQFDKVFWNPEELLK